MCLRLPILSFVRSFVTFKRSSAPYPPGYFYTRVELYFAAMGEADGTECTTACEAAFRVGLLCNGSDRGNRSVRHPTPKPAAAYEKSYHSDLWRRFGQPGTSYYKRNQALAELLSMANPTRVLECALARAHPQWHDMPISLCRPLLQLRATVASWLRPRCSTRHFGQCSDSGCIAIFPALLCVTRDT